MIEALYNDALAAVRAEIESTDARLEKLRLAEQTLAHLASLDGARAAVAPEAPQRRKRRMSASARKLIAAAQRARWAKWHAKKGRR